MDLVIPRGTRLFHGTLVEFPADKLNVGGYDSVLWTTDSAPVAQTYLECSGLSVSMGPGGMVWPSQDQHVQAVQARLGFDFGYDTPRGPVFDEKGRPSWHWPEGMPRDRWEAEAEIKRRILAAGWKPIRSGSEVFEFDFSNDKLLEPGQCAEGRLFILTVEQDLKIFDMTEGGELEGDLMDVDYHKLDVFRRAEADRYDGVKINDFAQSKIWGNFNHTSIGIFRRSFKKLSWVAIPARNFESEDIEAYRLRMTPEYEAWLAKEARTNHRQNSDDRLRSLERAALAGGGPAEWYAYGRELARRGQDPLEAYERAAVMSTSLEVLRDYVDAAFSTPAYFAEPRRDYSRPALHGAELEAFEEARQLVREHVGRVDEALSILRLRAYLGDKAAQAHLATLVPPTRGDHSLRISTRGMTARPWSVKPFRSLKVGSATEAVPERVMALLALAACDYVRPLAVGFRGFDSIDRLFELARTVCLARLLGRGECSDETVHELVRAMNERGGAGLDPTLFRVSRDQLTAAAIRAMAAMLTFARQISGLISVQAITGEPAPRVQIQYAWATRHFGRSVIEDCAEAVAWKAAADDPRLETEPSVRAPSEQIVEQFGRRALKPVLLAALNEASP